MPGSGQAIFRIKQNSGRMNGERRGDVYLELLDRGGGNIVNAFGFGDGVPENAPLIKRQSSYYAAIVGNRL
jgi:hypothetical protein